MPSLSAELLKILSLPRSAQPAAAIALREASVGGDEAWNTAFAPGSLFDAFSQSSVARGVYEANRQILRPLLGPDFRVVEIGGGNGRLWRGLLDERATGEILVIDPHPDGAAGISAEVPPGVVVRHACDSVQNVELPPCDVVICSLVLHHVAGTDAAHRAAHGLVGPGKREILAQVARASQLFILNEADVYCDLDLPPGDPVLLERLCDSYVRRFSVSLAHDIEQSTDSDLQNRWKAMVRDWGLGQLAVATAPIAERDVYERDVASWLALLDSAGLQVVSRKFTDPWLLFCQYVCRPKSSI